MRCEFWGEWVLGNLNSVLMFLQQTLYQLNNLLSPRPLLLICLATNLTLPEASWLTSLSLSFLFWREAYLCLQPQWAMVLNIKILSLFSELLRWILTYLLLIPSTSLEHKTTPFLLSYLSRGIYVRDMCLWVSTPELVSHPALTWTSEKQRPYVFFLPIAFSG